MGDEEEQDGDDAGDGGNDAGDGGKDGGNDGGSDGGNAGDAAADAGAGTNDSSLLDRLGKLPGLPATLRRDPAGPRVLPGAEDK